MGFWKSQKSNVQKAAPLAETKNQTGTAQTHIKKKGQHPALVHTQKKKVSTLHWYRSKKPKTRLAQHKLIQNSNPFQKKKGQHPALAQSVCQMLLSMSNSMSNDSGNDSSNE